MLIKDWKMYYAEHQGLECTAPCSMYSVLLEHGIIEDPFYGLNEQKLTELSDKDCSFEASFCVDDGLMASQYIELEFLGLDTLCEIVLNDQKIANTQNMHRAYCYDVKNILKKGENRLRLNFKSPTRYFNDMNNKHFLYTNGDTLKGAAHLRKALYMSGWDWGPKLPDMGIFRPVEIRGYDDDRIDNVKVLQYHKEDSVELEIRVETVRNAECEIYVEIDGQSIKLKDGVGYVTIKNPKLWWVRGYGEQYLYDLLVYLVCQGDILDRYEQKIGLRTLTINNQKDEDNKGSEFCFVINGVKIFAMGANYIPQDNLLSRINPDKTEKLMKAACDANFNCLRVWGGGYYPEDEFYDRCDELGFIVWQDCMVACANVWLRKRFKEEFIAETIYNVKRFRNHPSLGILCGNNEMEGALVSWGVGKSQLVRNDYIELYERILPDIFDEYAPQVFYWPSSPSSGGGFDDPDNESFGDVHYWTVWHGGVPFTEYRKHKFRFCSEYGFESYPSIKTINAFSEKKDQNCFSRVMENHQKCKAGNSKILMYLSDNYLYPYSFETLAYASQLLQADAIKYGVEHFRRNRGYCMGSLYWQFNDCWPVSSWSSVDSFGRYKALHYAAKKFYAPVGMGLFFEKNELTVNISNETMSDFNGTIRVCHCDSHFNLINSYDKNIKVEALTARDVFNTKIDYNDKHSEYIYADLFDENGVFVMRQTELFVKPKYFEWEKPEIKVDISNCDGGVNISLSSNVFAKGVCIDFEEYDCVLSDNFFDITNNKEYVITADTNYSAEQLRKSLKVMSVYDIGR